MADETSEDEGRPSGGAPSTGPRTQPEGVRIIGAQEAAEIVSRGDDRGADPTEAMPIPTADDGSGDPDRPALRFPTPDASSPSEFGSVPVVRADAEPTAPAAKPEQSFELPHYAEPPTGQVPKVVVGDDDSRFSGLADQPRWRDTEHHFDEQGGFDHLVDDAPRLGALAETGEHRDFFADLDLTDDGVPTIAGPPSREQRAVRVEPDQADDALDDEVEADGPRRPPGPRRRRPAAAPARSTALGADGGGGARNLPMAAAVGVGLLAVGAGCFYLGATATMVLITVVLCLCAAELFTSLSQSGYRPAGLLGVVAVAGLCIAPLYYGFFAYPVVFGLATLTGLAWFLFVQPGEGAVMNLGVTLLGIAYVGGLGSFATLMLGVARIVETDDTTNQGIGVLVAAVLVTVSYDVGAYFVGKSFGSTPLTQVSPNKTQEGLIGGVATAILVPFLILWLAGWDPVGVDWATAIRFCLICAVMAPVGDLCESAIKRDLGVKDMGTLLPGHGGVLDRFDAMLFVLPTAYFMAHLLELGKPAFF